ncbi:hypothetical protein ACWDAG_03455 [Streptomyces sp. NPDC001157]
MVGESAGLVMRLGAVGVLLVSAVLLGAVVAQLGLVEVPGTAARLLGLVEVPGRAARMPDLGVVLPRRVVRLGAVRVASGREEAEGLGE